MAYVLRDGVAVYYEAVGQGPAILLSHGYAATGRMWSRQVDALVQQKFTVIAWDFRGHGRTDSPVLPSAYSEAQTVADMAAILDAVGVRRAVIGGHSLGGYMSLAFHARHRDRVAALLLCGTGPGYRKDEAREAWNAAANGMADQVEIEGLEHVRGISPEMDPRDHKSVTGLVYAGRGMLTQSSATVIESLPSVTVPTFITAGADDTSYLSSTEYLESRIAGSERHVFDGVGHAANYEAPEEFNTRLTQFLAKHSDAVRDDEGVGS